MLALTDQHILVLGLGASGLAMARWCARAGARVTVADTRLAPPQLDALRRDVPGAQFLSGPFEVERMFSESVQAVFRSPGLAPETVAPVMAKARTAGLRVGGELTLFAQALTDLSASRSYAPRILAITGTNGKTTVTSLTGQLVGRSGKTVRIAGNIGPTLLDTLTLALDNEVLPDVWVLELSSFQLDGSEGFEPSAATVLNITQDHLDWHGSMSEYAAAKARVFGQHGLMVLNRDDPMVLAMLPAPGKGRPPRAHVTFGGGVPTRPGDWGIDVVNDMAWLVRALEVDDTRRRRKDVEEPLHLQRLMPADALRIRGRHNAVNALAALALATAAGCPLAPMLYGLREYRGEPHRVEPLGTILGVEYFDDSKGTNVGATVAALNGLGADRRVVVILGGEGKGQDFSPLAEPVVKYARAVILIGRDATRIRTALGAEASVPVLDAETLPQAVRLAQEQAMSGDAVLLSPACASFDMFDNYEHRARVFREAVAALADDAGVSLEGIG